ncbi:uncharacterized protein LOC110238009, partial [Exaiptasia diaphana]|uniref:Phytanoyl-CoA dioxygenase n=1 Tax=Exaiptasia diaphana TaxID=2652724 RepID=A0A913YJQ8_EXADI
FPIFEETVRDNKLLDYVEDLIGPNIRHIRQEKVNLKLPKGTRFPVKWHQDWAFYPHTNQKMLMACVSIDDTTRENGCLQVIPKSHKGPLFSHFKDGEFSAAINDELFDPSSTVHLEVPSGGVSLHHALTVHGSAPNNTNQKRRLLVFLYCNTDAWPLLGVTSMEYGNIGPVDWDRFTSTIVRGEATLFPKMESVQVCLPVPFDKPGYVFEEKVPITSSHEDPKN